ncbi:MAG: hypothetical protein L0332_27790 [Chloroflexi bacterium]|nr:hypothetical protein [Chloroflexota bacterium]MCI0577710.1 hypothetical protein [Chloroflexota bacterium]MCI0649793.1 hypothetical protein [Chloroflexota bacterium]MCI0730502.1 hypothetical protein [Chloroflexota bacterium]
MLLLDTDAMIDIMRGYPAAVAWLRLLGSSLVGLGVELATFNEKHYRAISTLRTIQPYSRTA